MAPQIPKLSDDALVGLPGAVVKAWEGSTLVGREALLGTFLVYAGNRIGNAAYSQYMTGTQHPPRLFGLIVGSSGAGKGTSLGEIVMLDHDVAQEGGEAPHFVANADKGIVSGAAFVESIALRGDGASSLLVEPEFSRLTSRARMDESLATYLMAAYDDGDLKHRVKAKNATLSVHDAHVSVLGHVVPYVLRTQFRDKEFANGFANRFIFFYTHPLFDEKAFTQNPNLIWGGTVDSVKKEDLVIRLNKHFKTPHKGALTWDKDATDTWSDFVLGRHRVRAARNDFEEPSLLDKMREPREFANVTRLAVTYALLDETNVGTGLIRKSHVEAALAVWDYSLASIAYIWALEEIASSDKLLEYLQNEFVSNSGAWIKASTVCESVYGVAKTQMVAFGADLSRLIRDGIVEQGRGEPGPSGGRPPHVIRLKV